MPFMLSLISNGSNESWTKQTSTSCFRTSHQIGLMRGSSRQQLTIHDFVVGLTRVVPLRLKKPALRNSLFCLPIWQQTQIFTTILTFYPSGGKACFTDTTTRAFWVVMIAGTYQIRQSRLTSLSIRQFLSTMGVEP